VLLRARAIENQCYVVAAGQIGDHDPGRSCFGRSMVIDPWGTVVAQAPDALGIAVADLDLERVSQIRQEIPSLANRRL
jgi:predicted amidohydrolase